MRKLLFISLLVALVAFATGCRIGGIANTNDNGAGPATTTTVTTKTVPLTVSIPQNIPSPSIKGNLNGTSLTAVYVVFGTNLIALTRDATQDVAASGTVPALAGYSNAAVDVTNVTSVGGYYSFKIRLVSGVNTYDMIASVPTALSYDATGKAKTVGIKFTSLTINADGSIAFTYFVIYTANGATSQTTGTSTQGTTPAPTAATPTSNTIPLGVNLPKNIPSGSIMSNFDGTGLTVNVVFGTTLVSLTRNTASDTATTANYYNPAVNVASATVVGSNYSFKISITSGGNTFYMTVAVPVALSTTSGVAAPVAISFTSLTINADGSVTFTVVIVYTATGATSPTTGSPTTGTTTAPTSGVLYIASATVGTSNLSQLSTSPTTGVDFLAPVFVISFNQAIKGIPSTFSVTVTDLANNNTLSMTAANNQITVATDSTGKIITATVTGQGARSLTPYTKYTIVASGTFTDTTTAANVYPISTTYYIQTRQAQMTAWYAMVGANVIATWTPALTSPTVASTANAVKITFDYPVSSTIANALTSSTFNSGDGGLSATGASYSSYFSPAMVDSTKTNVTIPFIKNLPVHAYSVTYGTGNLTDKNGNPINTIATVTFTVN